MDVFLPCKACRALKLTTLLIAYVLLCNLVRRGLASPDNLSKMHNFQMTELLNSLLKGYNKHLRPGFGGAPLEVMTNVLIRSMGPISEELMMFSMDCYFRQNWRDTRLRFKPHRNITELRPSIKMLNEIWKPDTFFLNGQDSYLHTITYENKLFRIKSNGDILYSQRLTIKSSCPMFLHKYPLDSQTCPLYIGSYGYTDKDVKLKWTDAKHPIKKYKDITMAQFTLTHIAHGNKSIEEFADRVIMHPPSFDANAERSALHIYFYLKREIGYYLLQIYLPCYLIVIISWVSFWINREATPARVTLGITTLLTTCTIAITGRTGIPKVSYSTALDIFLLMCFSFVFAALVEYAGVNYFTKSGNAEVPPEEEEENDPNKPLLKKSAATYSGGHGVRHMVTTDINGHTMVNVTEYRKDSCWVMFINCLKGNSKYRYFKSLHKTGTLSVSKIDSLARILFPFSFICLNILYWAGFLYYF